MNRSPARVTLGEQAVRAGRASGVSPRHGVLAVLAGLIALSAYGGALGLITGSLNPGDTVAGRLPFHSPMLGGLALIAVVAVPSTVLAWLAARGHRRTGDASIAVGVLLAGWILVEVAFIRELSFFHPTYVFLGVLLIWLGVRIRAHESGHIKAADETVP